MRAVGSHLASSSTGVGALACKFYARYKRHGQQVAITWNTTTVATIDATGQTITS